MKAIKPVTINLLSSNVPENDADAWAGGETYSTGDVVTYPALLYEWETSSSASGRNSYIHWNGSIFLCANMESPPNTILQKSTDGITWTAISVATAFPSGAYACGLTYGHDMWVLAMAIGSTNVSKIYTSTNDGVNWTERYSGSIYYLGRVAFGNGVFICGCYGHMRVLRSTNGTSWTLSGNISAGSDDTAWVPAYGGGVWVIVGLGGKYSSGDGGVTWTQRDAVSAVGLTHDGTNFFSSTGGGVKKSANGTTWADVTNPGSPNGSIGNCLGYLFVYEMDTGTIAISDDDGESWSFSDPGSDVTKNTSSFRTFATDGNIVVTGEINFFNVFTEDDFLGLNAWKFLYESLVDSNEGNLPPTSTTQWLSLGAINRYRMFDEFIVSATTLSTEINFEIDGTGIDTLAFFALTATTLKVEVFEGVASEWSDTTTLNGVQDIWIELGYTSATCTIEVTISGTGVVSCGKVAGGEEVDIGLTQAGPVVGLNSFSRVVEDDFGRTTITKRNSAKKFECEAWVETDNVTTVQRALASLDATPTAWLGDNGIGIEALLVYGIYRDFSIVVARVAPSMSTARFEIRGMI